MNDNKLNVIPDISIQASKVSTTAWLLESDHIILVCYFASLMINTSRNTEQV